MISPFDNLMPAVSMYLLQAITVLTIQQYYIVYNIKCLLLVFTNVSICTYVFSIKKSMTFQFYGMSCTLYF